MPIRGVQTLPEDQMIRIFNLIRSKYIKSILEDNKIKTIIEELKIEYARTMNKLIFDKYIDQSVNIIKKLVIPEVNYKKEVP